MKILKLYSKKEGVYVYLIILTLRSEVLDDSQQIYKIQEILVVKAIGSRDDNLCVVVAIG